METHTLLEHLKYQLKKRERKRKIIRKTFVVQVEMANIRPMSDHKLTSKIGCSFTNLFAAN